MALAAVLTGAPPARAQSAAMSCAEAGAVAERSHGLPPGLLAAIGKIESGRYDDRSGGIAAWPWTINAAGQGHHFDDKDSAIRTVAYLQGRGVRSIDVGCFQINLVHHPRAFASLDEGFDPMANADYAGRFLSELHARSGSWSDAVGAYHSGTPELGDAYRDRVLAAWTGAAGPAVAAPAMPVMTTASFSAQLPAINAHPAPMTARPAVVWAVSAQAMGIRVWTAMPPRAAVAKSSASAFATR